MDFQSEFKSGIENKTEKRAHDLSIIRKKKQEEKKHRLRHTSSGGGGGEPTFGASGGGVGDLPMAQLRALHQFLHVNYDNDKELDANMLKMFPTLMDNTCVEINQLIEYLHKSKGPEANFRAIKSIFVITQSKINFLLDFVSHLFQQQPPGGNNKFIEYCTKHLEENSEIAIDVWKTLSNLSMICKESRDIILHSDICKVYFPKFFEMNKKNHQMEQIIYYFIAGITTTGERDLPPEGFIKGVWLEIIERFKLTKQVIKNLDDGEDQDIVDCVLHTIYIIGKLSPRPFLQQLIQIGETKSGLITFLCKYVNSVQGCYLFWGVEFLTAALQTEPEPVGQIASRHCLDIIAHHCENMEPRVARTCIQWIGIFATVSFTNMKQVMDTGSLKPILNIIRLGRRFTKEIVSCIDVIDKIVANCVQALKRMDKRTEFVIDYLLFDADIIRLTVHFIRRDDTVMVFRVLNLWYTLMSVRRDDVISFLINNNAMETVETLVYSNVTDIYKLASEIQKVYDVYPKHILDELDTSAGAAGAGPMEFDF